MKASNANLQPCNDSDDDNNGGLPSQPPQLPPPRKTEIELLESLFKEKVATDDKLNKLFPGTGNIFKDKSTESDIEKLLFLI